MYEKRLDRTHPGCIYFLIDQSGSMREPIANGSGLSKADALSQAINSLLYELVLRCIKNPSEGPRRYYDIGVLGYGASIGPALGGSLATTSLVSIVDIANHPLRVEERPANMADLGGDQGTVPRTVKSPVWLEPLAQGGTPMNEAMNQAGAIIAGWVRENADSFPPIVINISDGASTDGDPVVWAERLQSLATHDGNVLLFNLNVSAAGGDAVYFPSDPGQLGNDYARSLFNMSSPLPAYMASLASSQGLPVGTGARGYVFNADMSAVVKFLQIGTATSQAMI